MRFFLELQFFSLLFFFFLTKSKQEIKPKFIVGVSFINNRKFVHLSMIKMAQYRNVKACTGTKYVQY